MKHGDLTKKKWWYHGDWMGSYTAVMVRIGVITPKENRPKMISGFREVPQNLPQITNLLLPYNHYIMVCELWYNRNIHF